MAAETGTRALEFTLNDVAESKPHTLADALKRGPAVVGIYKSSCQASKTMFPMLERLHQAYSIENLTVWGVSQDSSNVTRSFARRAGVTFPMLVEEEGYPISAAYAIEATPTVYLIDSDGKIVWQGMGFQKPAFEELNAKIAGLLGVEVADILEDTGDIPSWVPG